MNLTGIISISGKPGLYKVVAQTKNSIIVESLSDGKRIPAYAKDRISALEDISIYTYSDDTPLKEIYQTIYDKENGGEAPSHKGSANELKAYLSEILPDYDEERVYPSDIKKLFQWYNILQKSGNLTPVESEEKIEEKVEEKKPEKKATKKPAAKKAKSEDKADEKPKKKAPAKKPAAKKTTKKETK